MKQFGFSLIEVLVVIAIIGILSAVVLASLNVARDHATDARIKGEMDSIRTEAQIFYENNGNVYDSGADQGICEEDVVIRSLQKVFPEYDPDDVSTQQGINCNDDPQWWALSVPLNATSTYWCVDSEGRAKEIANTINEGELCPAS